MQEAVQALVLGTMIGAVFALVRLPVPAPATWAGIAGIVGLLAGWQAVTHLLP